MNVIHYEINGEEVTVGFDIDNEKRYIAINYDKSKTREELELEAFSMLIDSADTSIAPVMYMNSNGDIVKRQNIEVNIESLEDTIVPFAMKQGDTQVHEISISISPIPNFTWDSARVFYSNGGYQDINELTFTMKNSALAIAGRRSFEIEFKSGEKTRRTGKIKYMVKDSINADIQAYDKYEELDEIYNSYVSAMGNEDTRQTNETERIANENSRKESEAVRNRNEDQRQTNETNRGQTFTEKINDFETTGNQKIDDFVAETERVEGLYAGRVTKLESDVGDISKLEETNLVDDLVAHKESYVESKKLPHFNHAAQEYLNLDKFWDNLRDGKVYTVEFNQFSISPSPVGVKKDDNEGLVMEPSTNTERGRDDYSSIGLFKPIEVNAYVDENDDYHVTAMKGDGRFKRDGTMGDVYIMNMVGYQKRYSDENVWGISYSDTAYGGFEIIDEAVKPDGTIRPYLLHAKYVAGRNPHESNNLASISGVPAEHSGMSHNGQITEFKKKGAQYSGKTSHDDYYVQLIMWLKYANMSSSAIMRGADYYYYQHVNLLPENGVKRVVVSNSQANTYVIGSMVSIGDYGSGEISANRQSLQNYNLAERVTITDIVDLGDGNSAIYLDSASPFDTTYSTTITTYPWNSGSCDNVLGVDGSPTSFTSGKEPFIINGIEMVVGGYEVLQNLIILNNAADNRTDAYINYDCLTYATSITSDYQLAGQISTTNAAWRYGSKLSISDEHPSLILTTETEGSSTTGTGDGIYTNNPSDGGTRVWLSLGLLLNGALVGLRFLSAGNSLTRAHWYILGRLSATGRSRRRG